VGEQGVSELCERDAVELRHAGDEVWRLTVEAPGGAKSRVVDQHVDRDCLLGQARGELACGPRLFEVAGDGKYRACMAITQILGEGFEAVELSCAQNEARAAGSQSFGERLADTG